MLLALLIIAGLNLGILLVLAWVILRGGGEEPEYHVGFQMPTEEDEDFGSRS
jgi:hypothetical protein